MNQTLYKRTFLSTTTTGTAVLTAEWKLNNGKCPRGSVTRKNVQVRTCDIVVNMINPLLSSKPCCSCCNHQHCCHHNHDNPFVNFNICIIIQQAKFYYPPCQVHWCYDKMLMTERLTTEQLMDWTTNGPNNLWTERLMDQMTNEPNH